MSCPRARTLCLLILVFIASACARSTPEQSRPAASGGKNEEARTEVESAAPESPSPATALGPAESAQSAPLGAADESLTVSPPASPSKKGESAQREGSRAKATRAPSRPRAAAGSGALPAIESVGAAESLDQRALDRILDPAQTELPALRAALLDFAVEHEALSTAGSCNEACRAFSSMLRAKAKICGLVAGDDPEARCAAATTRLESARRALEGRCGSCP